MSAQGCADLQAVLEQLRGEQVVGNDQRIDGAISFTFGQQFSGLVDVIGLDQGDLRVLGNQVVGQRVAVGQRQTLAGQLIEAGGLFRAFAAEQHK